MPSTSIYFLDVGQGAAKVIRLPEPGTGIVVDTPEYDLTLACLERCGITCLRLILCTHSDQDHVRGLARLIGNFPGQIQTVAFNLDRLMASGRRKGPWTELERACLHRGLEPQAAYRDDAVVQRILHDGQVVGQILYPWHSNLLRSVLGQRVNHAAAVLQLRYGGKTVLLSSDVDRLGWTLLRDRGEDLRADVFEAVHHGAAFPTRPQTYQPLGKGPRRPLLTMPQLLEIVNPELVILSVGTTNPHGHPHPATLTALRQQGQCDRSLRLICTQLTPRCHDRPVERRARALEGLPAVCQSGLSAEVPTHCPCGGTIVVTLHENGAVDVQPSVVVHAQFLDSLDHPNCREPATGRV